MPLRKEQLIYLKVPSIIPKLLLTLKATIFTDLRKKSSSNIKNDQKPSSLIYLQGDFQQSMASYHAAQHQPPRLDAPPPCVV